ncbi:Mitotic spindle checkpoint protein BUBR1 [Carex littledalei]|uniref:Mitotic spindle checkpoint protein BUBR1 n=1 Tax=Carex littledalei TaxID=544730 RepID=A0A833QZP0_9POAL|nr:Mitotic spindle checkpoint protein BUBR1 [Carex littledalei]
MATEDEHRELFSSLISDIKRYSGSDPLRPWLHGIKRLKGALPPQELNDKLPRFLQKCAQTFESDHRYRNDARYVRVWIELMDYVDDAKVLLKKMEKNQIGLKRASYYIAYALYYEKHRKLEEAEKMYHAGVQILAEPVSELQKSYDQFLQRVELFKKKQLKLKVSRKFYFFFSSISNGEGTSENPSSNVGPTKRDKPRPETKIKSKTGSTKTTAHTGTNNLTRFNSENTIMVRKFVDSAIVGKSVAEMSCHNGLVEPTITTKEAMNAINNMFQEPLDLDPTIQRKSHRNKGNKTLNKENSGFEIFVDEEERPCKSNKNLGKFKPFVGDFTILPDEEPQNLNGNSKSLNHGLKEDTVMIRKFVGATISEEPKVENACHHGLVDPTMNLKEAMDEINGMFRKPMDFPKGARPKRGQKVALVEKKPVVDSTFSILPDDELEENTNPTHKPNSYSDSSFYILPDDELEENTNPTSKPYNISKGENPKMGKSSSLVGDNPVNGTRFSNSATEVKLNPTSKKAEGGGCCDGLFEPTFFTRQAMDDINEMFGKDIDF